MSIHKTIIEYLHQQREMHGDVAYYQEWTGPTVRYQDSATESDSGEAGTTYEESNMHKTFTQSSEWTGSETLDDLNSAICNCMLCPLGSTRTSFVFGSGNPNARLMIVGEAPGADEDKQGLPFVGRAGQLLTKILEAIDLPREEVYICNILKCRPPNNRKPLTSETDTCEPYLKKQIELVKPEFILALGLTAANTLLRNKESLGTMRATTHSYHGIPTKVTYHPAALLRNPAWKKDTWQDIQELQKMMGQA